MAKNQLYTNRYNIHGKRDLKHQVKLNVLIVEDVLEISLQTETSHHTDVWRIDASSDENIKIVMANVIHLKNYIKTFI